MSKIVTRKVLPNRLLNTIPQETQVGSKTDKLLSELLAEVRGLRQDLKTERMLRDASQFVWPQKLLMVIE